MCLLESRRIKGRFKRKSEEDIERSRFVSQRPKISGEEVLRKCSIEGKFECNPQTVEKQRERGFGDLGFVLGLLKLEA